MMNKKRKLTWQEREQTIWVTLLAQFVLFMTISTSSVPWKATTTTITHAFLWNAHPFSKRDSFSRSKRRETAPRFVSTSTSKRKEGSEAGKNAASNIKNNSNSASKGTKNVKKNDDETRKVPRSSSSDKSDASSSSSSSPPTVSAPSRNLYQVLGAKGTESREELKKLYVKLAKQTHPDAKKERNPNEPDFTEIAAAYSILSDPKQRKRYDRSLQAQQFSENVMELATAFGKTAAPIVENVALPFLRRTTVTTLASIQAAARDLSSQTQAQKQQQQKQQQQQEEERGKVDLQVEAAVPVSGMSEAVETSAASNITANGTAGAANVAAGNATATNAPVTLTSSSSGNQKRARTRAPASSASSYTPATVTSPDFSRTFQRAIEAARRAGRYVDSMELLEKAQDLERRAAKEQSAAEQTMEKIRETHNRRVQLALHTPSSGLSSADAMAVLQEYNKTVADQLTLWGRAMMKLTIEEEIVELEHAEKAFIEKQQEDQRAQQDYLKLVQERVRVKTDLVEAKKKELTLLRELEKAQEEVADNKAKLARLAMDLYAQEFQARRSSVEMEKRSQILRKQSEKVRKALIQKEKEVCQKRGEDSAPQPLPDPLDEEEVNKRLQEMEELRAKERELTDTSERLRMTSLRLLEKADQLKKQANQLKEME